MQDYSKKDIRCTLKFPLPPKKGMFYKGKLTSTYIRISVLESHSAVMWVMLVLETDTGVIQ